MALLKMRSLDPEWDWEFFVPDIPISPADVPQLRPLELESARSLWEELVSRDPRECHPMLLPRGHWLHNLVATGPDWQEAWERSSAPDDVREFLRLQIDWPDEAQAVFIWHREKAVSVPWGVFLRTWRNFLFHDEGPFLITLQHPEFVRFAPTALFGVGRRD